VVKPLDNTMAPSPAQPPPPPPTSPANDYVGLICSVLRKELEKPETRENLLQPLLKWFFKHIMPYVLAIVLLNFFMTIAAVSLVLYFRGR